eukprot:SAG25_NODE_354_length_9250_cov_2.824281_3_plen_146_part_00
MPQAMLDMIEDFVRKILVGAGYPANVLPDKLLKARPTRDGVFESYIRSRLWYTRWTSLVLHPSVVHLLAPADRASRLSRGGVILGLWKRDVKPHVLPFARKDTIIDHLLGKAFISEEDVDAAFGVSRSFPSFPMVPEILSRLFLD